jgi:SAM-dependent methyltransferase
VSHPEQQAFLSLVATSNKAVVAGGRVLEIGSYDVNGTVRRQFAPAASYVGVDLTPGPGVDRVMFGHEVDDPDGSFDVTLSGECFEHDPHWRDTFENMVRLTRPGGLVTFTCASTGRPEHGTTRTDPLMSPGTQAVGSDYYRNLGETDFQGLPLSTWFDSYRFWYIPTSLDLYFAGVRSGQGAGPSAAIPAAADVMRLASIMPWGHRLVRWPLRFASRNGEGPRFQDRALPYWRCVLGAGRVAGSIAPRVFRRVPPSD